MEYNSSDTLQLCIYTLLEEDFPRVEALLITGFAHCWSQLHLVIVRSTCMD